MDFMSYELVEKTVADFIEKEKSFDPRMIMLQSKTDLSLTEVGIHLKHMFNSHKMTGYTFQHYERTHGLITVYYKYVSLKEQLKRWFNV